MIFFISLLFVFTVFSNPISGIVIDKDSKESLSFVHIWAKHSKTGAITNDNGVFVISLNSKLQQDTLQVSYLGYQTVFIPINLQEIKHEQRYFLPAIELTPKALQGEEVEVFANPLFDRAIGTHSINMIGLSTSEAFLGQRDILKLVQTQPGAQMGQEGNANFIVRGGNKDQNIVYLDGVPIYFPVHAGGFVSNIHAEAPKHIEFYNGSFPVQFSGGVSSVTDISLKNGHSEKHKGNISLGIISADVFFEGPIQKSKSSYIVGYRKSLVTEVFNLINLQRNLFAPLVGFQDAIAKVTTQLLNKDIVSVYVSGSLDLNTQTVQSTSTISENNESTYIKSSNLSESKWSNFILSAKHFRSLRNATDFTTHLYLTGTRFTNSQHYKFSSGTIPSALILQTNFYSEYSSNLSDFAFKQDLRRNFGSTTAHLGYGYILHEMSTEPFVENRINHVSSLNSADKTAIHERFLFINVQNDMHNPFYYSIGVRNNWINSTLLIEPRLSISYRVSNSLNIDFSYNHTNQFAQQVSSTSATAPIEFWVPFSKSLPILTSKLTSIGISRKNKHLNYGVEFYYKTMDGLMEFKEGASFYNTNQPWQEQLTSGSGIAYGIDIYSSYDRNSFRIAVNYSFGKSNRTFSDLTDNNGFPAKYQRDNYAFAQIQWFPTKNLTLGLSTLAMNGYRFTLPSVFASGAFNLPLIPTYPNSHIYIYRERNNYVLPTYYRTDFQMSYTSAFKLITISYGLGVYNMLNSTNITQTLLEGPDSFSTSPGFPIIPFLNTKLVW